MAKTFKLFSPKLATPKVRAQERRGSRHERGYDAAWTRASAGYLKLHPLCAECERADIIVLADVVDHKIPVSLRPDLLMDPGNWWGLCHRCHNGMKRVMEAFAVAKGLVYLLQEWCDNPETRPPELARMRRRRPKEEYIV